MKKLLFTRESEYIAPLRALVERQTHRALVLWALDCAPEVLEIFERYYPEDKRPKEALTTADLWSRGEVKMPVAKAAIHAAHDAATATEEHPDAEASARAAGHAAATVHVETHALGLVFYGLTAFCYSAPESERDNLVAEKLQWFTDRLLYWEKETDKVDRPWASFLLKNKPNKERLLREKIEQKQGRQSAETK